MEAYSLFEVNQYIRRVVALNFEEPIWIECELNSVANSRGNVYLDLIEKSEEKDEVIAKASATIWYRQFLFIKKKLEKLTDSILSPGIKVKVKAQVEFSERYGFNLNIVDIDPAYTFGQFEMNRQNIIKRLQEQALMEVNGQLQLPTVIQKIAVISSETAAGYQDFMQQLAENPYGYDFEISLFQSAMQGQNTQRDVVQAIQSIKEEGGYDIIAIIRGGGSKLDLSAFDNYEIAYEISQCDIPVFTGIGHDIDMTVTDMVSYKILKTPTAVADCIIDVNSRFESDLLLLLQKIESQVKSRLQLEKDALNIIEDNLRSIPYSKIQLKKQEIDYLNSNLKSFAQQVVKEKTDRLSHFSDLIETINPDNILKRGFAIIKKGQKIVTRKKSFKNKEEFTIQFYDGVSEINKEVKK